MNPYDFVHSPKRYPENDIPVHERWTLILKYLPEMRTRCLSEDLNDIYQRVYDTESGVNLFCALDLAQLQFRYILGLYEKSIGRAHVNRFRIEAVAVWRNKLIDRMNHTKTWHVERKRDQDGEPIEILHHPKLPAKTHHRWMH